MNTSHTKLYLSLAQTRAYDGPIGDPFGGPAYGERAMPVAVVALAAGSFAAGAAAFTAATAISTMVLAGTLMVGSALTIVGTVTGNQNLTKIGGALALIGGGGLAIESLMSTAAEGAAGAAGAAAGETGAAGMESGFGGAMPDVTGAAQTSSVPMPDVTASVGGEAVAAAAPEAAVQAAPLPNGITETAIPAQEVTGTAESWNNFATPEAALNPAGQTMADPLADPLGQGVDQAQKLAGLNDSGMISGSFDKFGKWVSNNTELAKVGTQALAGMAGNLIPSDKDKAMTDYYQASAERARATTEDEKRRAAWRRGLINY